MDGYPTGAKYDAHAPYNEHPTIKKYCPNCDGTGEEIDGSTCKLCEGEGRIELTEEEYDELYRFNENDYEKE